MVPIYIAVVVGSPNNDSRVYRKLSSLSFPHPIGTRILIPNCEMVEVQYHHHDNAWKGSGGLSDDEAFYVFVSQLRSEQPDRPERAESEEYDYGRFSTFKDELFEDACNAFTNDGWEMVNEEIADYLSSNFLRP